MSTQGQFNRLYNITAEIVDQLVDEIELDEMLEAFSDSVIQDCLADIEETGARERLFRRIGRHEQAAALREERWKMETKIVARVHDLRRSNVLAESFPVKH